MKETIERTLVLLKPDAVKRGLLGEIITRFEKAGLKIVAMKLKWVEVEKAKKHYTEDISIRRGEKVRKVLLDFIITGPVLALVIEGVEAIENVRLMAGDTEPKSALPGTIRGDYSHVSYRHADLENKAVENIIHASSNKADAQREIYLWFNEDEIYDYQTVHEAHTF
ncbi:MAG: nucleoside-diphosphate kinase [Candidatus Buchananbacteria bacterium RIFCSPHIGHO2_02_FULL_40_13]|uniref:Nucleoside diphosphate kinase n=1 Tax=Candidatus Buchananbacteria bacterium RIFCSPLOWO2_01_FULL_39_33 TaxID=1797543 RepID=A0A1G1YL54_9BACT|nr:MAG: nucleoside-diphosphate kinase [Candidatus Buchananbacteria bacterium RIFCSPHIGHO2_01_FULL_40_35]OGY50558.1 MAG: nucleoside-diphosphate kinase [Candidatus Buchananbacteria bacterium RIFCSPHIGHO2_02_FULL_40_13]OGY53029.1 MAG: nucleoside-diphosphate kinase [Candidatus Buchananbacteria bacterium RIFCSPLOWO2_01_FULL_39_33]